MSAECQHTWELQRRYSKMRDITGIRRYRCSACGAWGWRNAQRRYRDGSSPPLSAIKPYHLTQTEPLPEWDEEARYERTVSMSGTVGSASLHGRGHGPDPYDEVERLAANQNRWPYQWKHKP